MARALWQSRPGYVSSVADQDLINFYYRNHTDSVFLIPCEWNCDSAAEVHRTSMSIVVRPGSYPSAMPNAPCTAVHWNHGKWKTNSASHVHRPPMPEIHPWMHHVRQLER